MPLWDRVRNELDRAGRAAQDALDEGKIRLEAFRARQLADRAAQALGYAVFRARRTGAELDAESYDRLAGALAGHEETASRLEDQLESIHHRRGGADEPGSGPGEHTESARPPEPPGAAAGADGPSSAARPQTDIPPMA